MGIFTKEFTFEDCEIYETSRANLFLYPTDKREKIMEIAEKIAKDNKQYLSTHCFFCNYQIYLKYVCRHDFNRNKQWQDYYYDNYKRMRLWFSVGFGVKLGDRQIRALLQNCVATGYFPEETKDEVNAFLVMKKLTGKY